MNLIQVAGCSALGMVALVITFRFIQASTGDVKKATTAAKLSSAIKFLTKKRSRVEADRVKNPSMNR